MEEETRSEIRIERVRVSPVQLIEETRKKSFHSSSCGYNMLETAVILYIEETFRQTLNASRL